jgi:hypothetical protein
MAKKSSLDPQLQNLVDDIDSIRRESADLLESLDQDQLNWRPAPERWSVAECFEHLSVTGESLVGPIRSAIDEARGKGIMKSGPYSYGLIGRFFIKSVQPDSRVKVRTQALYTPAPGSAFDGAVVQRRFMKLQEELRDIINTANGVDLARVKITSPAAKLLRINAAAWLESTVAHERRHIAQARRVTAEPGFPGGARR